MSHRKSLDEVLEAARLAAQEGRDNNVSQADQQVLDAAVVEAQAKLDASNA